MSKENVKKVVGTLLADNSFRDEFLSNPDGVMSRFELSSEEVAALKSIKREDLDAMDVNVEALAGVTERGPKIGIYIWS